MRVQNAIISYSVKLNAKICIMYGNMMLPVKKSILNLIEILKN